MPELILADPFFMDQKDNCKKTVLPGGVPIITQTSSAFYSAVVGIWVKNGSRDEGAHKNGISHFIEHMLFKGTSKRNPHDIAKTIDAVGGELNAFTTRETSCYYVKVLKNHLPVAIDLLADIFLNSLFDADELEKEREVILQEIRMVEDTPDDYVHDLLSKTFWPDSSLGRPVLGNVADISGFKREDLIGFMKQRYCPSRIVITAAGNVEHERLVDELGQSFSSLPLGRPSIREDTPSFSSNVTVLKKNLEQVHFCFGTKGVSDTDPKRYVAYILNTILGDGMGSRLFQEIREKKGLAYSVYSYLSSYIDCGMLGIYVGTGPQHFLGVLHMITVELKKLKSDQISSDELCSAREQLKGNMILGLESSESRMQRLAHNEICFGRHLSMEETIRQIDAVSPEDVLALARELFGDECLNAALIGDVKEGSVMGGLDEMKSELGG